MADDERLIENASATELIASCFHIFDSRITDACYQLSDKQARGLAVKFAEGILCKKDSEPPCTIADLRIAVRIVRRAAKGGPGGRGWRWKGGARVPRHPS